MAKRYSFLLAITLLIHIHSRAQHSNLFFEVTGGTGRLVPHYASMKNLAGQVSFINAKLGLKTSGQKEWQRVYNYPKIGIGLSHNYLTSSAIGDPSAIYSFIDLPLLPAAKVKIDLGLHLGLAWGFNPASDQNLGNIVIGSRCTAYGSININTAIKIGANFDLLLSAGGYHYSNGNTTRPNKGINLLGAETGLRFTFPKSDTELNTEPVAPKEKSSSIMVFGAWGWKKEATHSDQYPIGSFNAGVYRTLNHKSRLSTGIDLFYNKGILYYTQKDNELKNILATGIFGGHELTFSRLSIVTQLGIYLRNPHPSDPFYYERLGVRYIIAKRIIPSISLKAHNFKVDFVEWGMGFVLWNNAKSSG